MRVSHVLLLLALLVTTRTATAGGELPEECADETTQAASARGARPADAHKARVIGAAAAAQALAETWSPRTLTELNEYDVKVVRVAGAFTWHAHNHTDELFVLLSGELDIDFEEASGLPQAQLRATGDIVSVPRGVNHRPATPTGTEATILLVEPAGLINTGDAAHSSLTARQGQWLEWE